MYISINKSPNVDKVDKEKMEKCNFGFSQKRWIQTHTIHPKIMVQANILLKYLVPFTKFINVWSKSLVPFTK